MGQMKDRPGQASGPRLSDDAINRRVKDYSSTSYKPKTPVVLTPKQRRREDEENSR